MTEEEWLGGWDFQAMYAAIRGRATSRKVRLYMVACCRLLSDMFFDARIHSAVEACERIVADPEAEAVAIDLWERLVTTARPRHPQNALEVELGQTISGVWQLVREVPNEPTDDEPHSNADAAVAGAAFMSLREHPKVVFTGGRGDAVYYCAAAVDRAHSLARIGAAVAGEEVALETAAPHRRAMADLLRDIFGNPFCPASVERRYRTPQVLSLARSAYEERIAPDSSRPGWLVLDQARLLVLADALEEAGCDEQGILEHLRAHGEHVRGCFAVDLILGKE